MVVQRKKVEAENRCKLESLVNKTQRSKGRYVSLCHFFPPPLLHNMQRKEHCTHPNCLKKWNSACVIVTWSETEHCHKRWRKWCDPGVCSLRSTTWLSCCNLHNSTSVLIREGFLGLSYWRMYHPESMSFNRCSNIFSEWKYQIY